MPTRALSNPDPWEHMLAPPVNETPMERQMREEIERAAKFRSDQIDEQLRAEHKELRRRRVMKLLLLGQSESGKSTTLRQFQLQYNPQAFKAERATWRGVIQLNVVRSFRLILDAVADAQDRDSFEPTPDDSTSTVDRIAWTDEHERLKMRLAGLRHAETLLIERLRAPAEDDDAYAQAIARPSATRSASEFFVRPDWKHPFAKARLPHPRSSLDSALDTTDYVDEPTEIIHTCRGDMIDLWNDTAVRELLRRRKLRIEELSGFFLNDLERVAQRKYFPTSDDVLRARLKTVGVSEYRIDMEVPEMRSHASEWRIIDVGGARSQRPAWIPFFDDATAIIFLAPISAFDQVLAEDRSVNRLEDSVLLWKSICGNKLLAKIELILFLNKMDILDAKLKAGVRLAKYVRNFGDRSNDVETAAKYFRSKFNAIHREYSTQPRKFYCFTTSVTDVVTTSGILAAVRDIIIREYLKDSKLM